MKRTLSNGMDVRYVLVVGDNPIQTETRDGKIIEVISTETARIDISTGEPGTDDYKEHHAIAEYSADRKPGTFHFADDPEPTAAGTNGSEPHAPNGVDA